MSQTRSRYVIRVHHEPGPEGNIAVAYPLCMPGCMAQDATGEGVVADLTRFLDGYVESLRRRGLEPMEPDVPEGVGAITWHDYSAYGGGTAA